VVCRKGPVRNNNEDNFFLDGSWMQPEDAEQGMDLTKTGTQACQIYAVCDGMGGTDSGEAASLCAVRALAGHQTLRSGCVGEEDLVRALRGISGEVLGEARRSGKSAGTTIALVLVQRNRILAANVGDSRIYRYRKGQLRQVSEDHSRVAHMVRMGLISPQQARKDPGRHIISQYLGMPEQVQVCPCIKAAEKMKRHDMYLLCSDGLTDLVPDDEIKMILEKGGNPEEIAGVLSEAALQKGGRDNVTVMILQVCLRKNAGR